MLKDLQLGTLDVGKRSDGVPSDVKRIQLAWLFEVLAVREMN